MSYSRFKAFQAVAAERSFARAAERLRLTQPAVSIQVRNLEEEAGVRLFRRRGGEVTLTPEGAALLERTERMFRAEEEARQYLAATSDEYGATLTIGADGPHRVLDLLDRFRSGESNVQVDITLANGQQTWENVLNMTVDVAVLANPPRKEPGVISMKVGVQDLMALIPAGHPLGEREFVTIEELTDHPLIFRESGSITYSILTRAITKRNLAVSPVMTLGSREAVKLAVQRGLGIGFIYDSEVDQDPRAVAVPLKGFERTNVDYMVCLKDQMKNPLVKRLFNVAERVVASQVVEQG